MTVSINSSAAGVNQDDSHATKTITFDGTVGAVGATTVFSVSGEVLVERLVCMCTDSLTDTGTAGTPTISLGVTGSPALFIAATTTTDIDVDELWVDTGPDANGVAVPAALKDIAITDDIILTVANATPAVAEVSKATFPDKAGSTASDYLAVTAQDGTAYAVYTDTTGSDVAPTGAVYTAVTAGHKGKADISGATDAASVAAIFETAFNALTGFTAKITTDDTAADGTMLFTQVTKGAVADPTPHNADDSGAGAITVSVTTPGEDVEHIGGGTLQVDVWWKPLSAGASLG